MMLDCGCSVSDMSVLAQPCHGPVVDLTSGLRGALQTNYPEFPDSCLPAQFALFEDVHQVLVDRPHILLEKIGQEGLREPDRIEIDPALDARAPVLGLVEDDARLRLLVVGHCVLLQASR